MADINPPSETTYCDIADLQIGDTQLPPNKDPRDYIVRASRDIDIALGELYVVPLTYVVSGITPLVLRNVAADLASAYIIFSQAQVSESNLPNAYAMHLWQRAKAALDPYVCNGKSLPGATPTTEQGTNMDPVSVVQEDAGSLLAAYETFVTTPNPYAGEFYGPWAGRYGDGFQ